MLDLLSHIHIWEVAPTSGLWWVTHDLSERDIQHALMGLLTLKNLRNYGTQEINHRKGKVPQSTI